MTFKTFATTALFSLPLSVQAIELTDFTDPDTAFDEAYVDFNANANSGNQDQTSYDALLTGFYNKRDSSAARVIGLRVDGNLDASRGPNATDESVDDFGFSVAASRDAYFSETNDALFYFVSGDFAHQDSAVDDNLGVTTGVGYGRVWNATPLAKALRIQEALESRSLLRSELSDDSLMQLAAIIGRESEYRSREGASEYRGVWYSDMESVLVESGALVNEQLSALAVVELDDVLFDEPISARRHGWLVRAGAGFQSSDFSGLTDNDPKLTFQLEYAKPYGLKGQLINVASYEPIFGDNTVQNLNNRLSYSHEVSDRIDWINAWDLSVQRADDADDSGFTTNLLTSTFLYHLTNQLDLGLTLAAIDTDEKPNTNTGNDDVATSANLAVRYRVK
ncbi:hypothetical protein ACUNV4_06730 [Granulosicoccus sp. 3-233]|uniref:hypothetical protein n=1 Tax=Granulosicoccus sp. 3-233 TaxID=3417969 RepID=UPI003D3582A4